MTTSALTGAVPAQSIAYVEQDSLQQPAVAQPNPYQPKKRGTTPNQPQAPRDARTSRSARSGSGGVATTTYRTSQSDTAAAASKLRNVAVNQPSTVHGPHATELKALLARYDADGGNASRDAANAALGAQLEDVAMTGYPSDALPFERSLQTDLGLLAQLPPDRRDFYTDQLLTLWTGFEASSSEWTRGGFAHQERALHAAIADEHEDALNDPKLRAQAVFNEPYGSEFLSSDEQKLLDTLAKTHEQFTAARTPQQREAAFRRGSALKQQIQGKVAAAIGNVEQTQTQALNAARTDVLNALDYAKGLNGPGATSGARLTTFGNKVFTDALHARAFTSLRMNDPVRFGPLTQWENELAAQDRDAGERLPEVLLAPPQNFSDLTYNLPAPGPSYESDLLQRYKGTHQSIVAAEQRIHMAHEPTSSRIRLNYIRTHRTLPLD